MIAVLDASAAIEVMLQRTNAATISDVLRSAGLTLAPDLYVSEVTNALWKYVRAGGKSSEYTESLEDAVHIADDFIPLTELFREAFDLSVQHRHPVYDTVYLVVARRSQAKLLSLDNRLRALATKLEVSIFPSDIERK